MAKNRELIKVNEVKQLVKGKIYCDLPRIEDKTTFLKLVKLKGDRGIFKYHSGFDSYTGGDKTKLLSFHINSCLLWLHEVPEALLPEIAPRKGC